MVEIEEYNSGNKKGKTDEKEQIVELVYEVGIVHDPIRQGWRGSGATPEKMPGQNVFKAFSIGFLSCIFCSPHGQNH